MRRRAAVAPAVALAVALAAAGDRAFSLGIRVRAPAPLLLCAKAIVALAAMLLLLPIPPALIGALIHRLLGVPTRLSGLHGDLVTLDILMCAAGVLLTKVRWPSARSRALPLSYLASSFIAASLSPLVVLLLWHDSAAPSPLFVLIGSTLVAGWIGYVYYRLMRGDTMRGAHWQRAATSDASALQPPP